MCSCLLQQKVCTFSFYLFLFLHLFHLLYKNCLVLLINILFDQFKRRLFLKICLFSFYFSTHQWVSV